MSLLKIKTIRYNLVMANVQQMLYKSLWRDELCTVNLIEQRQDMTVEPFHLSILSPVSLPKQAP